MHRKEILTLVLILVLTFFSHSSSGFEQVSLVVSSHGLIDYSNEPPEGYLYLGAYLRGIIPDVYNEWVNQTGKGLAIYATCSVFGYPDTPVPNTGAPWITLTQRIESILPYLEDGTFDALCLTWQMQYDGSGTGMNECYLRVAGGEYDRFIRDSARWIKENFPYKLFIRLNHEFNLHSWKWGENPTAYIEAWKRVVDIFRSEGVNITWVWCPNANDNNPWGTHMPDYYPGDDYVGWVGTDLYANSWWGPEGGMATAEYMLEWGTYDFAVAHSKPFMICEWGLNITGDMTDGQNANWLMGFFDAIESRSNIKAIIHWGDARYGWYLLQYPSATQVYRNRVVDPRYLTEIHSSF